MHVFKAAYLLFGIVAVFGKPAKKGDVDPEVVDPDEGAVGAKPPEFVKGLLEGDMKTDKNSPEDRNAVSDPNKLWPQGRVPFTYHSSFSQTKRAAVQKAIDDYNKYTCIRFVPRRSEKSYVEIRDTSGGCFAWLGRAGIKQPLNLADGCMHKGTIIHEMLHTLGFAHEQARNDRDKYITVNWQNIDKPMHSQYNKMGAGNENNQGFGYDYHSVMHYPDWGFSSNGKPTITTKDPAMQKVIGQRQGFSKQDIQEVNRLYKCSGGSTGGGGGSTGTSGGSTGGNTNCKDRSDTYCRSIVARYGNTSKGCGYRSIANYCPKSCKKC